MVARKAEPGQFIILRVDEKGERIPITIWKDEAEWVLKDKVWDKVTFDNLFTTTVESTETTETTESSTTDNAVTENTEAVEGTESVQ